MMQMNPPKLTIMLALTGRDDRPEEETWLEALRGLEGTPVRRLMLILPSWWECPEPWKNDRIIAFVAWAKAWFPLPPIISVRRFPEWPSWLMPEHSDHKPSAYRAWDWFQSMRHLDECATRFRIKETFLEAEAYGWARDIVDLRNVSPPWLHWTLQRANFMRMARRIPKPDWARPGDAHAADHVNWLLGTVGKRAATDTLRTALRVPRAWRVVPPWHDGKVRMWLSYVGDGALTVGDVRGMVWATISRDLGSTGMERFPETVVLLSDVPGTLRMIEELAEWRAG